MYIKNIRVSNFKGFKEFEVEFNNLNVLIGANAAGKSSLVQMFKFLRDIVENGLGNAVSMQGGIEYLTNLKIGCNQPLEIELDIAGKGYSSSEYGKGFVLENGIFSEIENAKYSFSLIFDKNNGQKKYRISKDVMEIQYIVFEQKENRIDKIGEMNIDIFNKSGNFEIEINSSDIEIDKKDIFPAGYTNKKIKENKLLLEEPLVYTVAPSLQDFFEGVSLYNFDPNLPRSTSLAGRAELESDGGNLSLVLKKILDDEQKNRRMTNLLQDILPYVKKMEVGKFTDRSLIFKLQETYSGDEFIPAFLLSDGTISITALIIALYFEEREVAIFEEPERNIHPNLISRVVDMFYDAAANKQIIITTHNPEIVKFVDLQNLFLVKRTEEGFSAVEKPIEKDEVKVFLSSDMGIDDLYIQNLLEV